MEMSSAPPVYLDNQATTPVDPRVTDVVMPFFNGQFGNPHSTDHAYGWQAAAAVRRARSQVADFLGADDDEIIFTSGATESCNLALRGLVAASGKRRCRLVTVATEHSAVLSTVEQLGREGHEIDVLPVCRDGLLDLAVLERSLRTETLVVSVMAANNEIGVIQPMSEIVRSCRQAGAFLHSDATQAPARMGVDVGEWDVDLLSISSHKLYGPKGVGALFVREGVPFTGIVTGGLQERGIRPGTVPVMLVAGFGEACELAGADGETDQRRMASFTTRLRLGLESMCDGVVFFGSLLHRIPGSLCVGFPGVPARELISAVQDRVAVSTGAACSSHSAAPSRVLLALDYPPEVAMTGVRISLGRFTTEGDIETALSVFSHAVAGRAPV